MSIGPDAVRLASPPARASRRHLAAAVTVLTIAGVAFAGLWSVPIAMLAAGAGAGYSLSGSV